MTNDAPTFAVQYAEIEFDESATPHSVLSKDIYWSRGGALEEKEHVFLKTNEVPQRLKAAGTLSIGEMGFGSGLNFILSWRAARAAQATLQYIAFEKFPVKPDDLRRMHGLCGIAGELSDRLIESLDTPLVPGFHRFRFDGGRVHLTLAVGDARQLVRECVGVFDVWYLDWFSPSLEPDLWSSELLRELRYRSHSSTTLSTYSVSGRVCAALHEAGFMCTRVPGFAQKRENLLARADGTAQRPLLAPWFALPPAHTPCRAAILGAGLAGCWIAWALAERGFSVTVLDRGNTPACGASGNPAAIAVPYVAREPNRMTDFVLPAYLYFLRMAQAGLIPNFHSTGVLHIPMSERLQKLSQKLATVQIDPRILQHAGAEVLAEARLTASDVGLYYPGAGWTEPQALCRSLISTSPGISFHGGFEVSALERLNDGWQVVDANARQSIEADIVIVASAFESSRLRQLDFMPLEPIRGEIAVGRPEARLLPRRIVSYDGYFVPLDDATALFGASYRHNDMNSAQSAEIQHNLIRQGQQRLASLGQVEHLGGRVSFRTSTHHRFPYIGPVPDSAQFLAAFSELRRGKAWSAYPQIAYFPGLYVAAGFGSRGLITTPLAAEFLASLITGAPAPLPKYLLELLAPASYLVRTLQREGDHAIGGATDTAPR